MIRINCWFRVSFLNFQSISLISFGVSLNFVDLLMGFHFTKFRQPFLGIRQAPWFESAHDSSSISKTWIDSTHDSTGFPAINSISSWLKCIPQVLMQIDSWPRVLPHFLFKSTHDSSENHLILSLLMIRLWVIPMSGCEFRYAYSWETTAYQVQIEKLLVV